MQIDPSQHSAADNYKLPTNLVVPRPIKYRETPNKSQLCFDTFPVRPECRAKRGVSKERTGNTQHERTYSAFP